MTSICDANLINDSNCTDYKKYLGFLSIFIHIVFSAFMLITPFVTNNINLLMVLIFMNAGLLTEWYVLGGSVLNQYDKEAFTDEIVEAKYSYHTGADASLMIIYWHKLTGLEVETLGKITSFIPLFYIGYILLKIKKLAHLR